MKRVKSLSSLKEYFSNTEQDYLDRVEEQEEREIHRNDNPMNFLSEKLAYDRLI